MPSGSECRVGPGNFTLSPSQIPDLNLSIYPARVPLRLPLPLNLWAPPGMSLRWWRGRAHGRDYRGADALFTN